MSAPIAPPLAPDRIASAVSAALEPFPHLLFGFLFGSAAAGRLRSDSDVDVAVYQVSMGKLEIEVERDLEREADIQIAVERATQRNVELLNLNAAPATVCAAAVLTGRPVLMRDAAFYFRYFLAVTAATSEFLRTEREFRAIRSRSRSLTDADKSRLQRTLDYVETELQDRSKFRGVTLQHYRTDRDVRRNVDHWILMLINAALDIGKIVLASQRRPVPYTYGQILAELESVEHFSDLGGQLQPLAPLRNVLAHEYLELRFDRVARFADTGAPAIGRLAKLAQEWLHAQKPKDPP